jgi:hypothetical protein
LSASSIIGVQSIVGVERHQCAERQHHRRQALSASSIVSIVGIENYQHQAS